MDFVKIKLEEWGLGSLTEVFVDNLIDEAAFHMLTEADIKELIPALGTRKKFCFFYNNYTIEKTLPERHMDNEDTSSVASSSASNVSSVIDLSDACPQQYFPLKATLGAPYIITSNTCSDETLRKLLDTTEEGTIIKKSYGAGKKFLRTNLCNLIIKHELKKSKTKTIHTDRFKTIAQEINNVFLHESPEIYYLPYTRSNITNKVIAARGKLWSTYIHQRKLYRDAGLIQKTKNRSINNNVPSTQPYDDPCPSITSDALIWLKNNSEPFEQVLEYWRQTAQWRFEEQCSLTEYFKKYPALSRRSGHILIETDFHYLHEDKKNFLFIKWPIIYSEIFKFLEDKRDSFVRELFLKEKELYKDFAEDINQIIAIKLLPLLLQAPLIKCKKPWKLSKQELIDSFLLCIDDIGDLKKTLENRRLKFEHLKLTAQPIPVIVGPFNSCKCFVSIDSILYDVENPLKAIDLCFKLYHTLNARYPPEAEPTWTYIQKGVYTINTDQDTKYTSVNSLISDIKIAINL